MTIEAGKTQQLRIDTPLLITVILLTVMGLIMVFSASAVLAQEKFGSSLYFFQRMLLHAAIGYCLLYLLSKIPYTFWRRWVYPLFALSLLLMLLTLTTDWGVQVGGARRWLYFGPIHFQPSELAKLGLLLFLAYRLDKNPEKILSFSSGILPILVFTGLFTVFVFLGKDLGGAFVVGAVVLLLLFLGGARLRHLGLLILAGLPLLMHLILTEGYRLRRIFAFLNPWDDRYGAGFQVIQSFLAFNEGGFLGKGLGAGQQKLFYLPEAHTDFIFSVLGEELGVIGVLLTLGLFLFFIRRGLRIAARAPDLFGRFLALGVVTMIGVQSLLNMGVVLGLLPTKGLVLPFIGYGGTAMITALMGVGLLLNISRYPVRERPWSKF